MLVNRLIASRRAGVVATQVRAFGGAPHDPNHTYKFVESTGHDGTKTNIKVAAPHDLKYQLPHKGIRNEWFHMWLNGRWNPHHDEKLDNSRVNDFSMYAAIAKSPT